MIKLTILSQDDEESLDKNFKESLALQEVQVFEDILDILEQRQPTISRLTSQLCLRRLIDNSTAVQSGEGTTVLRISNIWRRLSDLGTQTLSEKGVENSCSR